MEEISITNRNCPVCGSPKGEGKLIWSFKEILPKEYHLPDKYNVVVCDNCGMCFADSRATEEDYDYYYTNVNLVSGRSVKDAPIRKSVLSNAVEKWIDKKKSILDIGTGNGWFLKFIRDMGYQNIYGMDTSEVNVKKLEDEGITSWYGSVYQRPRPDFQKFYAVFLLSVLEHLFTPDDAIKGLNDYVCEGGYVFIDVPDMDNIMHGKSYPATHFHHEHINYFSIRSLDNLFGKNGFRRVDYFPIKENTDIEALMLAVYQKGEKTELAFDAKTSSNIQLYLQEFSNNVRMNEDKHGILSILSEEKRKVVIYGFGSRIMQILGDKEDNLHIIDIIDGNELRWGQNVTIGSKDYIIKGIDSLCISDDVCFLICVNSHQYVEEITHIIKTHYQNNDIFVME